MQIDEGSADVVLRTLDELPETPSTVDIERAVADGRRRRQAKRIGGYGAAAGCTALVLIATTAIAGTWRGSEQPSPGTSMPATSDAAPPAPPAPKACTLSKLPIPDGRAMALVTGGDPTGRFLLGRTYPPPASAGGGMDLHIVIWDRLQPTMVAVPGDDQSLIDINTSGVAVGNSFDPGETAYFYRDGRVGRLPGGQGVAVRAINDAGTVVGSGDHGQPLIWHSVDQSPVALPLPPDAVTGVAFDIDEDGTVIGAVGRDRFTTRPYVWLPNGTGRELAIPADLAASASVPAFPPSADGRKAGTRSVPLAIVYNIRNGWITGRIGMTPVRWNLRSGEVRTFPEFAGMADGVNRHGWQVGIDRQGRAMLVSDAGPVILPDLATHTAGGLQNIPNTVSDDGTVIGGQSDDRDDVIRAVVWTCS
jgi:hypothetical protein